MRINKSARAVNPSKSFNINIYAPFYLTTIANRWTASASRRLLCEFGVGVTEWRVLAALRTFGTATSLEISNLIAIDTAAVSRTVGQLLKRKLIVAVKGRFKGRNKPMTLADSGTKLFEQIREIALQQEDLLLSDLNENERVIFLALLRRVHACVPLLSPRTGATASNAHSS